MKFTTVLFVLCSLRVAEAVTGKCGGNTDTSDDVDCANGDGTTAANTENKGPTATGNTTEECCQAVTVAGKCEGNTNPATNVDCAGGDGTTVANTQNKGPTVAGTTIQVCCEAPPPVTGKCMGNTNASTNVDCAGGDGTSAANVQNKGDTVAGTTIQVCCEAPATSTVTGKCMGNTNSSTNVECPANTQNKGASVAGTTTTACCEAVVTGKCTGNTNTANNVNCASGDGTTAANTKNKGASVTGTTKAVCCEAHPPCSVPADNSTASVMTYLTCIQTRAQDANAAWLAGLSGISTVSCTFIANSVKAMPAKCDMGLGAAFTMLMTASGAAMTENLATAVKGMNISHVCSQACKYPVADVNSNSSSSDKVDQVVVTFTWANLDHAKLVADASAKEGFVTDLKAAVKATLPEGYTLAHITVTLSAGSVVADVMITPLTGTTAAALTTTLSEPTKWNAVQSGVSTAMASSESAKKALAAGQTSVGAATAKAPAVAVGGVKPKPKAAIPAASSGKGAAIGVVMVGLVASRF